MTATISFLRQVAPQNELQEITPTKYVVLVDDDKAVRRAMARLIATFPYRVGTYPSGREFLDSLNAARPSCLIVDLQMQDMTGLELLHILVGKGLNIPTIVVTANDDPGMEHRCRLAGTVGFLVKPVLKDPLFKAIEAAIGAPDLDFAQGS